MIDATVGGLKGKFMTIKEYDELCMKISANNELIKQLQQDIGDTNG